MSFGFIAIKDFLYLISQSFDFERTRWRRFQERVAHTKFDIYVFICSIVLIQSECFDFFLT